MICVDINMFLKYPERYIEMAAHGTNVYICLPDGTELKLAKFIKQGE